MILQFTAAERHGSFCLGLKCIERPPSTTDDKKTWRQRRKETARAATMRNEALMARARVGCVRAGSRGGTRAKWERRA